MTSLSVAQERLAAFGGYDKWLSAIREVVHRPAHASRLGFASYVGPGTEVAWVKAGYVGKTRGWSADYSLPPRVYPQPGAVRAALARECQRAGHAAVASELERGCRGTVREALARWLGDRYRVPVKGGWGFSPPSQAEMAAYGAALDPRNGPALSNMPEWLHQPLQDEEAGRLRYRPDVAPRSLLAWGPRYGVALGLYWDLMPKGPAELVSVILRSWEDTVDRSLGGVCLQTGPVRRYLKEIGTWAKKAGDTIPNWQFLVGLELQGGYLQPLGPVEVQAEMRAWVGEESEAEDPGGALPGWWDCFKQGADLFLEGMRTDHPLEYKSLDAYIAGGKWARTGSADLRPNVTVRDSEGKHTGVRMTKDLLYLAYTPAEISNYIRTTTRTYPRALIKRETGKSRSVIITDLAIHIQMAYAAEWFEGALRGRAASTLYFKRGGLAPLWEDMAYRMGGDQGWWAAPLDQSSFDHHVSRGAIAVCMTALAAKSPPPIRDVIHDCVHKICYLPSEVEVKGQPSVPVARGVISGWRWTSHIDTHVNFAETVGSLLWLVAIGVLPRGQLSDIRYCFQGDDVRLLVRNPGVGIAVAEVLRMAGLDINPGKTWISPYRDEFLRRVAEGGVVYGYPARALPAVLWRNPVRPEELGVVDRVGAASKRWATLAGRGCRTARVRHHAQNEVERLARSFATLPADVLRQWIVTPSPWGGGGLGSLLRDGAVAYRAVILPAGTGKTTAARLLPGVLDIDDIIFGPPGQTDSNGVMVAVRRPGGKPLSPEGARPREQDSPPDVWARRKKYPYEEYIARAKRELALAPGLVLLCHDVEQAGAIGAKVVGAIRRDIVYYQTLEPEERRRAALSNIAKGTGGIEGWTIARNGPEVTRCVLGAILGAGEPGVADGGICAGGGAWWCGRDVASTYSGPAVKVVQPRPDTDMALGGFLGLSNILARVDEAGAGASAAAVIRRVAEGAIQPFDPRALLERSDAGDVTVAPRVYNVSPRGTARAMARGRAMIRLLVGLGSNVRPGPISGASPYVGTGYPPYPTAAAYRPEFLEGFADWVRLSAVRGAAFDGGIAWVEAQLHPPLVNLSRYILSRHGKGTWMSWLLGTLKLTTVVFPGWDTGYLAARWAKVHDWLIGRALQGSTPMRASAWPELDIAQARLQRHPMSLFPYPVGP